MSLTRINRAKQLAERMQQGSQPQPQPTTEEHEVFYGNPRYARRGRNPQITASPATDQWDGSRPGDTTSTIRFTDAPAYAEPTHTHLPVPVPRRTSRRSFFTTLAAGSITVAGVGFLVYEAVGKNWFTEHEYDTTYGYPRIYQTDAVVGHGDSEASPSHFIALNLYGQIAVLEYPGRNLAKGITYLVNSTLIGLEVDKIPVIVSFKVLTSSGQKDMIISLLDSEGNATHMVWLNKGQKFEPAPPGSSFTI